MRPIDLITCSIEPTLVNSYLIKRIEVDLKHINYGFNQNKEYSTRARSNFVIAEIVLFFESLDGLQTGAERDNDWEYFVVDKIFFEGQKNYRIVFCIDIKNPHVSGIITLFQVKRSAYELS